MLFAKHIDGESYEEWKRRSEALNKSHQTIPPTQYIDTPHTEMVDYPDGTEVQWISSCNCALGLLVFYEEGNYRTFARCPSCGVQADIHTG